MVEITKKHKKPPPKRRRINHKKIIDNFNIPKTICLHLIGEHHTVNHRMGAGALVMTIGVLIAKATSHIYVISFFGEMVGYFIHGVGSIPFGEKLIAYVASTNKSLSFPTKEEIVEEGERIN